MQSVIHSARIEILLKGGDRMALSFEEEVQKTKEALDDVRQYLSHEACTTRRQLIEVLAGRIEVIESDLKADQPLEVHVVPDFLEELRRH